MDYKDILAIIIIVVVAFIAGKFFPNNPLGIIVNYIKNLFIPKS